MKLKFCNFKTRIRLLRDLYPYWRIMGWAGIRIGLIGIIIGLIRIVTAIKPIEIVAAIKLNFTIAIEIVTVIRPIEIVTAIRPIGIVTAIRPIGIVTAIGSIITSKPILKPINSSTFNNLAFKTCWIAFSCLFIVAISIIVIVTRAYNRFKEQQAVYLMDIVEPYIIQGPMVGNPPEPTKQVVFLLSSENKPIKTIRIPKVFRENLKREATSNSDSVQRYMYKWTIPTNIKNLECHVSAKFKSREMFQLIYPEFKQLIYPDAYAEAENSSQEANVDWPSIAALFSLMFAENTAISKSWGQPGKSKCILKQAKSRLARPSGRDSRKTIAQYPLFFGEPVIRKVYPPKDVTSNKFRRHLFETIFKIKTEKRVRFQSSIQKKMIY